MWEALKPIIQKVAKLIDLKSLVTIAITIGLIWGFFDGKIPTDQYVTIAIMIFTFYFTKRSDGNV